MRIVVVSPFAAERSALHTILAEDGFSVAEAATSAEALEIAAADPPDVVVADAQVAGHDGLELVEALSVRRLAPFLILLSSRATRALKSGVVALTKPIDLAQLRRLLSRSPLLSTRSA